MSEEDAALQVERLYILLKQKENDEKVCIIAGPAYQQSNPESLGKNKRKTGFCKKRCNK